MCWRAPGQGYADKTAGLAQDEGWRNHRHQRVQGVSRCRWSHSTYHETTKHYFGRFARSRGSLDWATQPDPFRRYPGARVISLPQEEATTEGDRGVDRGGTTPLHRDSIGWFLRYSMGLSAWKAYRDTRWALRVNPSSGNLHPTEAYSSTTGTSVTMRHANTRSRSVRSFRTGVGAVSDGRPAFLVALTSIQWREAWKYGERAFRYCQHDVGHAIAALRVSASLFGWRFRLLTEWSDKQLATLLGVDRDEDCGEAEPERPECLALVGSSVSWTTGDPASLLGCARNAAWQGHANVLSRGHDEWPIIERVTDATEY